MCLKALRVSKGKTQTALAKELGISQGALSMWETGLSAPKITDLPKIAAALNVPVEQVLECFIEKTEKEGA